MTVHIDYESKLGAVVPSRPIYDMVVYARGVLILVQRGGMGFIVDPWSRRTAHLRSF